MRRFHAKLVGTAAVAGFLVAGVAGARLIPGGGNAHSDCFVELDVSGATSDSNHITCTDGDPTCDVDGQCQGTCTFSIAVCVDQTNVSGCMPKPLSRPPFVSNRDLRAHRPILQGATPSCGEPTPVTVKVVSRHGARKLPGRAKIGTRASGPGSPRGDKDFLFLTCVPATSCSIQTTTTTSTTTTTTVH